MRTSEFKQQFADLIASVNAREGSAVAAIDRELEDGSHSVEARCHLRCMRAFALARAGATSEAAECAHALLPVASRKVMHDVVAQCHRVLAECGELRGDQLAYRMHCMEALAASRRCSDFSLRYACEMHVANLIGEWGHPAHAAKVFQHLYETTDWTEPSRASFLAASLGLMSWWLTSSGHAEEALRYLNNPACLVPETPYRHHTVMVGIAYARQTLGEPLDVDHLERLLSTALHNEWHASAAELHFLISREAPDDSPLAKANASLALGLEAYCSVALRLMVIRRALECAIARGDQEAVAQLGRRERQQLDAIAQAAERAPLICPLSGEVVQ